MTWAWPRPGLPNAWRPRPNWPGPPRHRPSPCSKRPSATVPTTCPPANSLGVALEILGRREEAIRVFEGVLRIDPAHELALRDSGRLLASLQRPDLARAVLQKTIAVNPWRSDYRLVLAQVCSQAGDWPGAIAACREAIRLNPDSVDARSLLVESYLRSDDRKQADAEFQTLIRSYPASRNVWRQWYERQKESLRREIDSRTRAQSSG